MKVTINHVSGHQTSKVFALVFALLTLPFLLIGLFGIIFGSQPQTVDGQPVPQFPFILFLLLPVLYGVMGYLMTRLGCFCYNLVAKRVGGIEFETTDKSEV